MRNQVFVFNSDGSFKSTIGERGKGPEGIVQVAGFDINHKGEIFILDSGQLLLKTFDVNGQILASTSFFEKQPFFPTLFSLTWYKDKIVSSILERRYLQEPYKSKLVAVMDVQGNVEALLGEHDPFTKQDYQHTFYNEIALDEENHLLYTNLKSSPYYQIYNLKTGAKVAYEGVKTNSFKLPDQELELYIPAKEKLDGLTGTTVVRRLYLTDKYVLQHLQVLTQEWFDTRDVSAKENILVFYDRETNEFIQEVKLSDLPVGVHNNHLYIVEDLNPDNYTIGIYEIVAEDN